MDNANIEQFRDWLGHLLTKMPHGTKGKLALAMGLSGPKLSRILSGERNVLADEIKAAEQFFGTKMPVLSSLVASPTQFASASDARPEDLSGKQILLIISGGIAAYKSLELIRRLRRAGAQLRIVMTKAAEQFVTPLSVGALGATKIHTELFDREAETDIGHIRLARENDLIIIAPATADLIAKMACGLADDLASTILLAKNAPVLLAPAMNPAMWAHAATRRNVQTLLDDGCMLIGPNEGEMAEAGEAGVGRMAEPGEILAAAARLLSGKENAQQNRSTAKPLVGRRALVTAGPTHEPIDPVRYIANRSSGKQGYAIAAALADLGAETILVSGPVNINPLENVEIVKVETARQMLVACEAALPADIAIMVAAVADWRSATKADKKMKKIDGKGPDTLMLVENPDILKTIGHHSKRPHLVIGFAAETENIEKFALAKLKRKNANWIIANDVSPQSGVEGGVMGGDRNQVKILMRRHGAESNKNESVKAAEDKSKKTAQDVTIETWPELSKTGTAMRLADKIADYFTKNFLNV